MRARLAESLADAHFAQRATDIVRSCVHCGFCNATCPTYQLSGDELEGPRGRVYLIKSLLEAGEMGPDTRTHLDQCLVCRNCETTCPSGVRYGELVELVRPFVYEKTTGGWREALVRGAIKRLVPHPRRFAPALGLGRMLRPFLPRALARMIPAPFQQTAGAPAALPDDAPIVLLLSGCAQPAINPGIDAAAVQVFATMGFRALMVGGGCCGALAHHLGDESMGQAQARANIDSWWSYVEQGAQAIVATSSGCGVQLKSYARLLSEDPIYAERAARIEALVRDPLELVDAERLAQAMATADKTRIAIQTPCSLQHGQQLAGRLDALMAALGFELCVVNESHLCCGSAGAYSLMHRETAQALRERKLQHLLAGEPDAVVTANIGCQTHLSDPDGIPVMHWLEFIAARLG